MINKTNPYLENSIQTASPGQLLLMLYDAAMKQCKLGIDAIEQKQVQQANTALIKCQDIIQEMGRDTGTADILSQRHCQRNLRGGIR